MALDVVLAHVEVYYWLRLLLHLHSHSSLVLAPDQLGLLHRIQNDLNVFALEKRLHPVEQVRKHEVVERREVFDALLVQSRERLDRRDVQVTSVDCCFVVFDVRQNAADVHAGDRSLADLVFRYLSLHIFLVRHAHLLHALHDTVDEFVYLLLVLADLHHGHLGFSLVSDFAPLQSHNIRKVQISANSFQGLKRGPEFKQARVVGAGRTENEHTRLGNDHLPDEVPGLGIGGNHLILFQTGEQRAVGRVAVGEHACLAVERRCKLPQVVDVLELVLADLQIGGELAHVLAVVGSIVFEALGAVVVIWGAGALVIGCLPVFSIHFVFGYSAN